MPKLHNIAVVRVATFDDEERLELHGKLIESYFPSIITKSYCIQDQYNGVHDDDSRQIATKKIVDLVKQIQNEYEGIVISCADDPAVEILRNEINIPVVGAGHSSASFSLNFGEKIGVLGIREEAPESVKKILGDRLIKSIKPDKVYNTNDLLTEEGRQSVIEAAHELQKSGADVIILACTGMSTIGIAEFLNQLLQINIIDPVYSEALVINSLCKHASYFQKEACNG